MCCNSSLFLPFKFKTKLIRHNNMSTRTTRSSASNGTSNKREITSFFSPKSKRARVATLEDEIVDIGVTATESPSSLGPSEETKEEKSTNEEVETSVETTIILPTSAPAETPLFDIGSWSGLLGDEFAKSYFRTLMKYVDQEYKTATVYPPQEQIFTAFHTCDLNQLKVVIIGQDPYHGANQAHGLAFSVLEGNAPPPSLRNIFKEAKVCSFFPPPPRPSF
jgi:hypothetical protein